MFPGMLKEVAIPIDFDIDAGPIVLRVIVEPVPGQTDGEGTTALITVMKDMDLLQPQWVASIDPFLTGPGQPFAFLNGHVKIIELAKEIFATEGIQNFLNQIVEGADAGKTVADGAFVFGADFADAPGDFLCARQDSLSHHWV